MIPAGFEYEVAESVEHAVELLAREDAKVIAGGQSLLPMMRLRLARPTLLVDVGRLDDLRYVRATGDRLLIGALTRHSDLERDPLVGEHCPVLAEAVRLVADPQIRHRGTVGGSLAHGDPAGDLPAVLLALEADLVVRGPDGERVVPAAEFFVSLFETALGPRDVLTEIRIPSGAEGVYLKLSRRSQDWATVGVAAVRVGGNVRVALTNMGSTPLRATGVEAALASGADAAAAAERAGDGTSPPSDPAASSEFRTHLAQVLVRRALEQLGV